MELAYLGPAGTFSEEAARRYAERLRGEVLELVPVKSLPELLLAVDKDRFPLGIVPVENSIEGPVVLTLDMLVHEVSLHIVAEEVLPVRHQLLVRPGVTLRDISCVLSHPQALAQCRRTLDMLLPGIETSVTSSTAEAARRVATSDKPWAAIATSLAAELYGLSTLRTDIQDQDENTTRFLVVGKEAGKRTGFDKTSIAFAFDTDRPGNLYAALRCFAERNINLTKLESRPAKRSLGDYIFFVDMEGHIEDVEVQEAIDELKGVCSFVRILGSYPRAVYPGSNGARQRAAARQHQS